MSSGLTLGHWLIIVVVLVLVFAPKRFAEIAGATGRFLGKLRGAQTSRKRGTDHVGSTRSREEARPARDPAKDTPPDPFEVLGVPRHATDDEVAAAFREKTATNHPDRLERMDPELRRFAERRLRRIVGAYEEIKARRGHRS